jgi:hypothetical protein
MLNELTPVNANLKGGTFTIAVICTLLILSGPAHAKRFRGKESHRSDFCGILGVNATSCKKLEPALQAFSDLIDQPQGFYGELKKLGFSWGHYGHRLLFHWGFNSDPRHSEALSGQVKNTVPSPLQSDFYRLIIQEQQRRNREMITLIRNTFGISRKQNASGLATILYDTHLLGDYACSWCSQSHALPAVYTIKNDINVRGLKRLFRAGSVRKALMRKLDKIDQVGIDSRKTSAALLAALMNTQDGLPSLLREQYASEFEKKGLSFDKNVVGSVWSRIRKAF